MPKPIPEGYHTITPSLVFKDARKAIAFYKKAFGAQELFVIPTPAGKIMHASLKIGDSIFMLGEENPAWPDQRSAESAGGGACFSLYLYVPDADAAFKQAVGAGAKAAEPPMDAFWGDRSARVIDPFGYSWGLLTHVRDVSPEKMQQAAEEWMTQAAAKK